MKEETKEVQEFNSAEYWEKRYAAGGNSGDGSRGALAAFKGNIVAEFLVQNKIDSVIDWGSGDGIQYKMIFGCKDCVYTHSYIGFDVSKTCVDYCNELIAALDPCARFYLYGEYLGQQAELGLSLDVIYHLVEDNVFEGYMARLCDSATRYLIIYSSDGGKVEKPAQHLKERCFTKWIAENRPEWKLKKVVTNPFPYIGAGNAIQSISDFYFYSKNDSSIILP